MENNDTLNTLIEKSKGKGAEDIIKHAYETFGPKVKFATSLGEEDQVITDIIARVAPGIEVSTLDTGRLFTESYDLMAKTQQRYPQLNLKIYYPDTESVQEMVNNKGINLFYQSVDNRKTCCGVRKVEPLKRALADAEAWIVGLRRDQSVTRTTLDIIEWDSSNEKIKINPLAGWSLDQVHAYIKEHRIDVNPLHAQGFISIGCAPCTRAIKPGDDIRAGRWWWEQPEQKECGLHHNPKWKGNKQ